MNNIIETQNEWGYFSYFKNDQVFANHVKRGQIYESQLVITELAPYIRNSKLILDIGAHAGTHTILYKYLNPKAEIHSFEPQIHIFRLLQHNVLKNQFKNVFLYRNGVGHAVSKYTMQNSPTDGSNAGKSIEYGTSNDFNLGGLSLGRGGEEVDIISIDSLKLKKIDFIKIDVEGYESLVFHGAKNTIEQHKPVIFFEHEPKIKHATIETLNDLNFKESLSDPISFLKHLNYILKPINNNYLAIPHNVNITQT